MRLLTAFLFIFISSLGFLAQAEFKVPALTGPVIDEVGYLDRSDRQELMQLLYDFNRRGKAQMQVMIVPDLQGLTIEQASMEIVDKLKLGDEKKDNGILLLVSAQERALRIEVGQGLEGAIPDITAKRIISDQIIPLFRSKRFSSGIVVGVHEVLRLADKEFADENKLEESSSGGSIPVGVIILLLIVISVLGRFGGGRGSHMRGGGPWGGGYGGGGWGSGGGGSSGGGWSGGGGGFSGGGASGNW